MELARPSRKTNGKGVQVEDTQICVVMVGLPARGKSLIAQKGRLFRFLGQTCAANGRCRACRSFESISGEALYPQQQLLLCSQM